MPFGGADKIKIEDLAFYGHCGITPEEKKTGQRFSVDLEISCDISKIAKTDRLEDAYDYAAIAQRLIEVGRKEEFQLIETMAERMAQIVLEEFGAKKIFLRLKKQFPPIEPVMAHAAVEIYREA